MIAGFFLISLVVLGEYFNNALLASNKAVKELIVCFQFIIVGSVFLLIGGDGRPFFSHDFFTDWRFWVLAGLESCTLWFMLLCMERNKAQVHVVGYFQFLTLPLIPIVVLVFDYLNLFPGSMQMPFTEIWHWVLFVAFNMSLTAMFIGPKLKQGSIPNISSLIMLSSCLCLTIIFSVKLIQIYPNAILLYAFIFIFKSIVYLLLSFDKIRKLEWNKELQSFVTITTIKCSAIFMVIWGLNLIAAKLIPVELFAIFKRLSQVSNSYLFDAINKKTLRFISRKDVSIVGSILAFNVILITVV